MKIREQDLPRGPATVFRRLAALVYDGLLLLAVLFLGVRPGPAMRRRHAHAREARE